MYTDKHSLVATIVFCICIIFANHVYAENFERPLGPMRHIDTNSSAEEIKFEFNRRENICEKYVFAEGISTQCMYACGMLYRNSVLAGQNTRNIAIKKCNETFSQVDIKKAEQRRKELIVRLGAPKTIEDFSDDMKRFARALDNIGNKTKEVALKERAKRAVAQCGLDLATLLYTNKTSNKWALSHIEEFWSKCKMEHDEIKQGHVSGYKSPSYMTCGLFYMRPSALIHFIDASYSKEIVAAEFINQVDLCQKYMYPASKCLEECGFYKEPDFSDEGINECNRAFYILNLSRMAENYYTQKTKDEAPKDKNKLLSGLKKFSEEFENIANTSSDALIKERAEELAKACQEEHHSYSKKKAMYGLYKAQDIWWNSKESLKLLKQGIYDD